MAGCVYAIRNRETGRILLRSAQDIRRCQNLFDFSVRTGSCVHPKLSCDWARLGPQAFELQILEELKQGETQTDAEYKADIEALEELWREKYSPGQLY